MNYVVVNCSTCVPDIIPSELASLLRHSRLSLISSCGHRVLSSRPSRRPAPLVCNSPVHISTSTARFASMAALTASLGVVSAYSLTRRCLAGFIDGRGIVFVALLGLCNADVCVVGFIATSRRRWMY